MESGFFMEGCTDDGRCVKKKSERDGQQKRTVIINIEKKNVNKNYDKMFFDRRNYF